MHTYMKELALELWKHPKVKMFFLSLTTDLRFLQFVGELNQIVSRPKSLASPPLLW